MIARKPTTPPPLTLITDTSRISGEAFFNIVAQALDGGVDAVLLREKTMDSGKLLALAARLRTMTQQVGARLIIHTQADIADAVDADGIHLASCDITQITALRKYWLTAEKTLSVSCHHAGELELAHDLGADYAMLSPVFPTLSHPETPPLGVAKFKSLCAINSAISSASSSATSAATGLPIVALGGITTHNCNALAKHPLAVIGAILNADDPFSAAQHLHQTASASKPKEPPL